MNCGRYSLDVDLKNTVTADKLESTASRVESRKVSLANVSGSQPLVSSPQFYSR